MADRPFTQADLDVLAQWDTPTICNGLEVVVPERRAIGFTVEPMVCIDPKAKPIVGLARVGMIRSTEPPRGKVTDRADWYDYVAATDFPTIAVIQDIDGRIGYGADFHGAVVIPADAVRKLPAAIDLISRREKVILDVCRSADFTPAKLRDALKRAGEIH